MKFLCRNCKAKYQIADEKVAGRTLRMTCQQCGEPIVVRGPARTATGNVPRPPAPVALGATAQGSALGADFQRQLSQPSREMSTLPTNEEWHVAINDVPVGPMRRDEVARKIALGAIDRESLAWREGMDDWVAIRHIAELAPLFGSHTQPNNVIAAMPAPPPQAMVPAAPAPMMHAERAPTGSRQVVAGEEYAVSEEPEVPVTVAVVTNPAADTARGGGGLQIGWAQGFMILSGVVLLVAVGALLGIRTLSPTAPAPAPAPVIAAAPSAPAAPTEPQPSAAPNVIELDTQAIDGTSSSGTRKPSNNGDNASQAADKKSKQPQLTAEQKETLQRMGGSFNQGPSNLKAPSDLSQHTSSAQGSGQLTAEQLSQVVLGGRKNLQRCYETALRGASSTETVRLDVDIQVSPAGNVQSARTTGKGLPGMDECIVRTVKMWRFPNSGDTTQTRFPVVFQPGT